MMLPTGYNWFMVCFDYVNQIALGLKEKLGCCRLYEWKKDGIWLVSIVVGY